MGMNIRSHIAWKRALSGGRGEQSPEPGRDGEGAGAGGRPHPGDRRKEGADSLVTSLGKFRISRHLLHSEGSNFTLWKSGCLVSS